MRGVVFEGEAMTCVICGQVKVHDPAKSSNWMHIRSLDTDEGFYVCPKHKSLTWDRAEEMLRKAIEKAQGEAPIDINWQIDVDRPKGIMTMKITVPPALK